MVGAWIGISLGVIAVIGGILALVMKNAQNSYNRTGWVLGGVASIILGFVIVIGCAFWLYGTQAGERAQKSFHSNTGGGIERVVTVYDMNGDKIATYDGKFDVDANDSRIIFDIPQADGASKRVQIWMGTGATVTIVEK